MSHSSSISVGNLNSPRQSRRTIRREGHIFPGILGPGTLDGTEHGELLLTQAECNGPGVDVDAAKTMFLTCTVEFPAPGVGVILTETCTSGVA